MHFRLPATNGYTFEVKTEGDHAAVTLSRRNPLLTATYYVNESVSDGTIDADLGALGRIDVSFEPVGEERIIHISRRSRSIRGCLVPDAVVRQPGAFSGTISFRGEGGYATVEASQAAGSVGPSARPRCGAIATASSGAPTGLPVERVRTLEDATLISHDSSSADHPIATYFAVLTEGRYARYLVDRVEVPSTGPPVIRSAAIAAPRQSFYYRPDLRAARVQPPPPFSGEAHCWRRHPRLVGDLAVELPGLPPQPLTGPGFETRIDAFR